MKLLILLVLITISLLNAVNPTIDISSISSNGYLSTTSHGSVIDESGIYIAGGWNGNSKNYFQQYNITINSWQSIHNNGVFTSRCQFAMSIYDHIIYVIGGFHPAPDFIYNDMISYNIKTNTWRSSTYKAIMCNRAHAYNGVIYLIAGQTQSGFVNDVMKYSIATSTWSTITTTGDTLIARRSYGSTINDNMIYVIGGWGSSSLSDVMQFNIHTSVWTKIIYTGSFTARQEHAVAYHNNAIYVHGGQTGWTSGILSDIVMLDLTSYTWYTIVSSTVARSGHSMTAYGNVLFVMSNDVAKFTIEDGRSPTASSSSPSYQPTAVSTPTYSPTAAPRSNKAEYKYTGVIQTYTIPFNVTTIDVKIWGSGGGGGDTFGGGSGGFTSCTLKVVPGEILTIIVGGGGGPSLGGWGTIATGGFGGGGRGITYSVCAAGSGGGGGRSTIQRYNEDIVTAGGGGGGGITGGGRSYINNGGAGGGLQGLPLKPSISVGSGGTQSSGGITPDSCGRNGTKYIGGEAHCTCAAGGGGGYYGGASGGNPGWGDGGGGGGSGYAEKNSTTNEVITTGNSGSPNVNVLPPNVNDFDYVNGVGIGGKIRSSGGNGLIIIVPNSSPATLFPSYQPTTSPTSSSPSYQPTISPTSSSPSYQPTISPTSSSPSYQPSIAPSFTPTTLAPSSNIPSIAPTTSTNPTTKKPTIKKKINKAPRKHYIYRTHSPTRKPTIKK